MLSDRGAAWRRPLAGLLFVAALAAAGGRIPTPAAPAFAPPPGVAASVPARPFELTAVPGTPPEAQTPSLAELPDRRLAAAWIAGRPGDPDEATIWLAIHDAGGWQPAQPVIGREATAGAAFAHVGRLATPVLYAEGGWLHLWYAASAVGSTLGRALYHATSTDGGRHWSTPLRLTTAPLAASAALLGGPPLALADGGLGLPLGQDLLTGTTSWLRLSATSRGLDKIRLPGTGGAPAAVAALDERRALAIHGPRAPATPWQRTLSADGGESWQAAEPLALAGGGRPALLRLSSGRLLLAAAAADGRGLQCWLSDDAGGHWRASRRLEATEVAGAPALLQTRDGRIHLLYAAGPLGLRHARFDEAWLKEGQ